MKCEFKPGTMVRHKNSLDIDLYVWTSSEDDEGRVKLFVRYWNRTHKLFQGCAETVIVQPNDRRFWENAV